ncbi:TonB-dependent receptor [Niabella sp. CC-SYL272]|uniref:SusC/RagA family TonB-linked outer membrane protein n=1 Tax=Niabella agricola TaxID=2891571 RepID=UPI001F3215F0|nr:TonB-dependent receptor [Niabella agricola]MCF3108677.1 TonB-dependent receptor [Niabella agricola]
MIRQKLREKKSILCRCLIWILLPLLISGTAYAQGNRISVKGVVQDAQGPLAGASVVLKNDSTVATKTDANGSYVLLAPANGQLIFSMVSYLTKEVAINGDAQINVTLELGNDQMEEVAVVAFGIQKKSTMVGAVTTINPKELKGPTSNLTTMLAGNIAGMIAYQRSGEPGRDNAQFFIRGITTFGTGKRDPLILIDGRESSADDLARLQPDDIAGFSVLKDATATSVYGARGANGVVLVTTKTGDAGKTRFNARFENSVSANTQNFKLSDNITYMKLANEAATTRDPLSPALYTPSKIAHTAAGDNPYLYPDNDWIKQMIRPYTNNTRLDMNASGGTEKVQYYISGTYNIDNGVLKTIHSNSFNSNVQYKNYEMRSNVTVKMTPTTQAIVRVTGRFGDYNGPIGGGGGIFDQILKSNPVMFPAYFPQSFLPDVRHPLFGNNKTGGALYQNPFANSVSGFQQSSTSDLIAQLELKQNLNFLLQGLSARLMAYTQRSAAFDLSRSYTPFYYQANVDPEVGLNGLTLLNEDAATSYLNYNPGGKTVNLYNYLETAVNYNTTIKEKHEISGMVVSILGNRLNANAGNLEGSLPQRNLGVSGRFTYGYDRRYLMEFDFGYNGSERFAKDHRFGFFPSIGLAWNVSREQFWEFMTPAISNLKFRATYGLVGNDQIGNTSDRFFYLSNVDMNAGGRGYTWGTQMDYSKPGIVVTRYENKNIGWEKAYKADIGMDLGLWNNNLNLIIDFYKERRTNILMTRGYVPTSMGLNAPIQANVGEAEGKGMDASLDYGKYFSKDVWLKVRGNFTYATSKMLVNEEPNYPENQKILSRIGYSLYQTWGLVADRYFIDQNEVNNSPRQNYGGYMAGDLKYLDINGDGQITNLDMVPIGYPTVPEIIYGAGFSFGYKNFDISAFAQGSGRSSFFIDPGSIQPFVGQNGLLKVIAEDHWSENDPNPYAFYPRLSTQSIGNNLVTSTWWMRNGVFLRIKRVELGYNVPMQQLKKWKINALRLYLNGLNLFAFSRFRLWDVEMGGNGLGYPVQRVYNVGINLGF